MAEPEIPKTELPELPPLNEINTLEFDAPQVALRGLKRWVTAFRLARTEESLAEHEVHDEVIKAAPSGAHTVRHFRSTPEDAAVIPIRPTERLTSWWRQVQSRRIRRNEDERARILSVYGEKPDTPKRTPSGARDGNTGSADAKKWDDQVKKMAAHDSNKEHDLGSENHRTRLFGPPNRGSEGRERMLPRTRAAELRAAASDSRARRVVENTEERLSRGETGDTFFGRRREKRIERTTRRRDKLAKRLEELR